MRLRLDPFVLALLAAALLASYLPLTGNGLDTAKDVAVVVIGVLFFLYGTRLSTEDTIAGIRHWRLQLTILATTYVAFPLAGLAAQLLEPSILTPALASGVLMLCLIPSTVQSCVVFTQMARGNVAAAVVSASLSNLLGVFLTPALVAVLLSADAGVDASSIVRIVLQLLAPFLLGQLVRPVVGRALERHGTILKRYDKASIVLIVYIAFSEAAEADVWSSLDVGDLLIVLAVCAFLLVLAYGGLWVAGRAAGFTRPDRVALLFCGSNKSLASGLPIATVLFSGGTVALIVLPLMFYHQLQVISGAWLAQRLAPPRDL